MCMPKQCKKCGKSSQIQTKRKLLRGNYNPTVKKRKYPNIQWSTDAEGNRIKICTQCIKTKSKQS